MARDKTGIITGAGSGIGEGAAFEFSKIGCRLILVDQDSDRCEAVASRLRESGAEVIVMQADVRDAARMSDVARQGSDAFGHIDFVVANAGITYQSTTSAGDPERWRAVVDTNVIGTMLTVRAVLPFMLDQGTGHIFLVASMSGRKAHVGEPAYVASKFAVVGFGHALRLEVEPSNIRVTLVEPGLVMTSILDGNPRIDAMLERVTPLTPADVARTMVFAFEQPQHVVINEIALRPLAQ